MALSKAELDAARKELDEANERLGYRRNPQSAPAPQPGGSENGREETATSPEAAPEPPTADPGPPRFIGVDLDHRAAGLSGGAFIPISEGAISAIVDVLLGELRINLDRTLALVRATHIPPVDPAQVEIELPDGPRDPA
jgi:hypothetical protein